MDDKTISIKAELLKMPIEKLAQIAHEFKNNLPSEVTTKLTEAGYQWNKDWTWTKSS